MTSFLPYVSVVVGLIILVWSSDKFVDAAANTASILKVSPFVVGMVIVGFGTSAPELIVSLQAALEGNPGVAIGNAFGSNIANMTLILGSAALLQPLLINKIAIKRDLPILIAITLFVGVLTFDLFLSRIDAIILLALLGIIMTWQTLNAKHKNLMPEEFEFDAQDQNHKDGEQGKNPLFKNLVWIIIGLVLLVVSAKMLVWGSVIIARSFGISDLVIGLTLVAVGTSLPELAASVTAAIKGKADLAVGNVIGSNLFNTLGVLGVAGAVAPLELERNMLVRDLPITLIITIAMLGLGMQKSHKIQKWQGGILLLVFVGFQVSLFV